MVGRRWKYGRRRGCARWPRCCRRRSDPKTSQEGDVTSSPGSAGIPEPVPTSVRAVGIVLGVAGAMWLIVGVTRVSSSDRPGAVLAIGAMVLGAVCLVLGWKLVQGARWAYFATAVVLVLAIVGGVVSAIQAGDRAALAQVFVPGLGLYLLSRRESRDRFMV